MAKDVDLFRTAMAHVTPLKGRKPLSSVAPKAKAEASRKPPEKSLSSIGMTKVPTPSLEPLSFDRDIDRALSRGRRSPEATLDLHGMTLAAAERAVSRFLEEVVALDLRVVLIVTGKGLREEGGRLMGGRIRSEFPVWLSHAGNRARVRGLRPAHPRHGGSGAFYVLLRRRSSASSRSLRATPQR
jgi:DNA-nicking Smr family endonuclease